jgi:hypothetical protein
MPAYSFKQRFIPMVMDGSKSHTIRARREKGYSKIGDTLYLYFGMRTKWCTKIREEKCTNIRTIVITEYDIFLCSYRFTDYEVQVLEDQLLAGKGADVGIKLDETLRNTLAWCDGFRPEGSTKDAPGNAFELMIRFWRSTHQLPFIGDLIDWKPTPEGLTKAKAHVKKDKLVKKL